MSVIKEYTTTGVKEWIDASGDNQVVVVKISGSATVDVEATISDLARNQQEVSFTVQNLVGVTADTAQTILNTPITNLRVNVRSISGSVTFQVGDF